MKRKTELPENWVQQAFKFELAPTPHQADRMNRHFGMRRKAYNWTVATIKDLMCIYNQRISEGMTQKKARKGLTKTAFRSLRDLWNQQKRSLCVDAETGEEYWQEVSKEAAANGVYDAVKAYWDWIASRTGKRKGPKLGFVQFKKKGRCTDSYRLASSNYFWFLDRRHMHLARLGNVALKENARRLARLLDKDRAKLNNATISRHAGRYYISIQVDVLRPQVNHKVSNPDSRIGIDLGTRLFAVVADMQGNILERIRHPKALTQALKDLAKLNRKLSRAQKDSNRRKELQMQLAKVHAHVANVRRDFIHKLTTRLAKTHGQIVIEDLNVKGMMRKNKCPGGRARRRALADAALGEFRRQLTYKCPWYGSKLVIANRWFPSSQICHACEHRQKNLWEAEWTCNHCGITHDRDDNAAINLARYVPLDNGKWVLEGAQQSCGCGPCTELRGERKSGIKTERVESPCGKASGVASSEEAPTAAAPKREPISGNPGRGHSSPVNKH